MVKIKEAGGKEVSRSYRILESSPGILPLSSQPKT